MRPGLEEMFDDETRDLFDKSITHYVRFMKWSRLIQLQEGCVRTYKDGSIVSEIGPEDVKDSEEYLERLKQLRIPL